MAETKPGNPDRGWNDPPMFLYNSDGKVQSSSRKNPLTQRVGVHQSYTSKTPTAGINPGLLQTNPPTGPSGPPLLPFTSPLTVDSTTPTARSNKVKVEEDHSLEVSDGDCDASVAELRSVLRHCEEKIKARVADDIKRKIDVLESAWKTGKLSKVVQQRMTRLSTALSGRDYSKAHDVHLSLMVDYVSEVSQWMVGIKRLILEARTILPPEMTGQEDESNSEETTKDELNQRQSVDDLVPHIFKVNDEQCRPSGEETVKNEGDDKRLPDEDELDKAKITVSQPSVSRMSNEEETDTTDSPQDETKTS